MKICEKCGCENRDEAKFCVNCGDNLETHIKPQNMTYQTQNKKNSLVAIILNLICGLILYCLCGIGHILYLKLYKRGLILCAIGLLISVIAGIINIFNDSLIITLLSFILGVGLTIYSVYDAHKCCNAINEGSDLPLLFTFIDTETLTQTHVILIILICVVGLIALAGAIFLTPDSSTSYSGADLILDDDNLIESESNVQIKITCPVEWSASIGDEDSSKDYEGTCNAIFDIDGSDHDVIAATVQKTESGSDKLKVEIIKDGKVLDKDSTTEDYGVVTVSAFL